MSSEDQNKINDGLTKYQLYYRRHKEELINKAKKYNEQHPEIVKRADKKRSKTKKRIEWKKKWNLKNQEVLNKKQRERRKRNMEACREYSYKNYHGKEKFVRQEMRMNLMVLLGGPRCVRCGFIDVRALQFDHINGDDYAEERKGKRVDDRVSKWFYLKYLSDPELARKRLQVLCANCNWIKRVENNEHRKRK